MAKFSIAIRKTKKRRNTHKKESNNNYRKQFNKKEQTIITITKSPSDQCPNRSIKPLDAVGWSTRPNPLPNKRNLIPQR